MISLPFNGSLLSDKDSIKLLCAVCVGVELIQTNFRRKTQVVMFNVCFLFLFATLVLSASCHKFKKMVKTNKSFNFFHHSIYFIVIMLCISFWTRYVWNIEDYVAMRLFLCFHSLCWDSIWPKMILFSGCTKVACSGSAEKLLGKKLML